MGVQYSRRLYNALATDERIQPLFDMASNSYFLPPEYAAMNCEYGNLGTPWFSSIPSTVEVGVTFSVTASIGWFTPNCGPILYNFIMDGQYQAGGVGGLSFTANMTANSQGTKQVTATAQCTFADSAVKFVIASVDAEDPPNCTALELDSVAGGYLATLSIKQYERGTSFLCSNGTPVPRPTVSSGQGPNDDKCSFELNDQEGDIGWAHTHPFFVYSPSSSVILNCGGREVHLNNFGEVSAENSTADQFSDYDISISSPAYPGYLKGPSGVVQKCLGPGTGC